MGKQTGILPAWFHSVLLPERFGGHTPPCTFGIRVSGLLQSRIHSRSLPEGRSRRGTLLGGPSWFSGNFPCRYPICANTLPRPAGVVNRVFPQNVRKAGTDILCARTAGLALSGGRPPEKSRKKEPRRAPQPVKNTQNRREEGNQRNTGRKEGKSGKGQGISRAKKLTF